VIACPECGAAIQEGAESGLQSEVQAG